ncbi:uncharacterized protein (DUF1501 family) [Actinoplanes campanulatus]|uniref:Uncharacterized protein (DUF1501 family) n=1 Tax=Actinoplanes campanulatus TaxID=113559 RepID=A0A7W5AQR8_9ACTN|nr:DUF1501 domain-containing protein [Actinoplanes campanulatus]MBB3100727.1 uncharacterized protein (DUF1501 family) [Actinoplanes campanulatus]GGN46034.1 hypothetical protein GCM10010109_80810 [Actinoplanes campanulatus]GID41211.1 hypothetical protein Aca09nite_77170 [Actinoplanes campanulatus]
MDTVTRRRFLIASGVTGAVALAAGATAYTLDDILATSVDRDDTAKTLVLVTLYGGNDGLNTVIPYADPAYRTARPGMAYNPATILRLDGEYGLNPGLTGLHRLYQDDRLAVIQGVGYPRPNRSHFQSMDIWQTAQPDRPGATGWLGRWLDTTGGDPRLAVSFEPALPPLLAGATSAGATVPGGELALPGGVQPATIERLSRPELTASPALARAAGCFADLMRVQDMLRSVEEGAGEEENDDGEAPTATATGGAAPPLDRQLALVARCIEGGAATRVYSVSLGGFDLHADGKDSQQAQLTRLDQPLAAFADRMAGRGVVIAVYSEFGRRVHANASDGTDHGTASTMFLLGDGVRGGRHGEPPSLTDLDDGDLRHTVDFRDVYATLLAGVLGSDPGRSLDGWSGRLEGVLA